MHKRIIFSRCAVSVLCAAAGAAGAAGAGRTAGFVTLATLAAPSCCTLPAASSGGTLYRLPHYGQNAPFPTLSFPQF